MLKLSNLKSGDLNKIEQALNLLKNLKINDGNNELSLKSFNKSNSSMTFVNQKGGEVKLELYGGNGLYSETSIDSSIRGGNGLYSETSDAFIRGGSNGLYSETSVDNSVKGGSGLYSETSDAFVRGDGNGLYSETSVIGSMKGGSNGLYSETSLNSVGINNPSMLSETSIDNAYSATSAMESDAQFNLQNLFIKANGGGSGAGASNNTLSLSSITELKERNNSNMSVLRNKGLLGGGAKGAVSANNKLRTYDINSSSTNSVCE
jgi:hypothetical protein